MARRTQTARGSIGLIADLKWSRADSVRLGSYRADWGVLTKPSWNLGTTAPSDFHLIRVVGQSLSRRHPKSTEHTSTALPLITHQHTPYKHIPTHCTPAYTPPTHCIALHISPTAPTNTHYTTTHSSNTLHQVHTPPPHTRPLPHPKPPHHDIPPVPHTTNTRTCQCSTMPVLKNTSTANTSTAQHQYSTTPVQHSTNTEQYQYIPAHVQQTPVQHNTSTAQHQYGTTPVQHNTNTEQHQYSKHQ